MLFLGRHGRLRQAGAPGCITLSVVIARETKSTVAIQLEIQVDCFVATLLAKTDRV
jgi:hypothetical protein